MHRNITKVLLTSGLLTTFLSVQADNFGNGVNAAHGSKNIPISNLVGPSNTAIPGIKMVLDPDNEQLYVFHGNYYRKIQQTQGMPEGGMHIGEITSTKKLLQLDPKAINKIYNIMDINNKPTLFLEDNHHQKIAVTYDETFTHIISRKKIGSIHGITQYLLDPTTVEVDVPEQGQVHNIFINNKDQGVDYDPQTQAYSDHLAINNQESVTDFAHFLFPKPCASPSCMRAVYNYFNRSVFSKVHRTYAFQDTQYTETGWNGDEFGLMKADIFSNFFGFGYQSWADTFHYSSTATAAFSTITPIPVPADAPKGLSITSILSTHSSKNLCFTIFNNSKTDYSHIPLEVELSSAVRDPYRPYLEYGMLVDKDSPAPNTGYAYCLNPSYGPASAKGWSVDILPPNMQS